MIYNSRKTKINALLILRKEDPKKFWLAIRKLLPVKTNATYIKLRNNMTKRASPP